MNKAEGATVGKEGRSRSTHLSYISGVHLPPVNQYHLDLHDPGR